MSNYREAALTGSKWLRSHWVVIENPLLGEKAITFHEQTVKQTSDGAMEFEGAGALRQALVDPTIPFALRSPVDDSPYTNPDGSPVTMTYAQVQVALHSLYLHLASLRDGVTLDGASAPG